MARRRESQATAPAEVDLGFHVPHDSHEDEPSRWPTDDGFDSPIPTLGVIDLPESDPGYSERGGVLPVESVCVSTGNPPKSLRRVSLPPMVKPLASDPAADLSPVLLDIQLPDVKLPQPAGTRNARPHFSGTIQDDFPGTVTSSDGTGTGTETGGSAATHRGQSLRGCLLLVAMIAAAGSLIAVLILVLNASTESPEAGQSTTWLSPVEPKNQSRPIAVAPLNVEPVQPDAPKVAQVVAPIQEATETPVRKPRQRKPSRPPSPPVDQTTARKLQEIRTVQSEEPEPQIPTQEAELAAPQPKRALIDRGSQPKPVRSKMVSRARPTRSIAFPESALRLLHDQRDTEIIITVAVNRFGFPKATDIRSNAPLPDLAIGLFERAIDDVKWTPAKNDFGESIADVVSVRFRAVEGGS